MGPALPRGRQPDSPTWQCFPPQPGAHSHWSGRMQAPPFRQGLAQMAGGRRKDPLERPRGLPSHPGCTFPRPRKSASPSSQARAPGCRFFHPWQHTACVCRTSLLTSLHATRYVVLEHSARLWTPTYGSWSGFLVCLLKDPGTQAPYPSPVSAADAPSRAQGQVGLIHRLAVGLVVTERYHQCLLGADPLTAPMQGKVGGIEWARPWGAWSLRALQAHRGPVLPSGDSLTPILNFVGPCEAPPRFSEHLTLNLPLPPRCHLSLRDPALDPSPDISRRSESPLRRVHSPALDPMTP